MTTDSRGASHESGRSRGRVESVEQGSSVETEQQLASLRGPVFQPLEDPEYFARFILDDTLTWPNGADFAPEFLHDRVVEARGIRAERGGP